MGINMSTIDSKYDVIIIGSGIGSLACASILAQMENRRVLVLERHFKIGGFTHIFKRQGKYEWDVGIHYIGQMEKGYMSRALFDYITGGKVQWFKMPDYYDVFVYPDFTFKAHAGRQIFMGDVINQFPDEQEAIETYFNDIKKASKWMGKLFMANALPKGLNPLSSLLKKGGSELALMITKKYLDTHFEDPKLKALLVSQWGDYGLPPNLSAFGIHSLIANHYIQGGWYPVGSSRTIADSIIEIVENKDGALLVNQFVDKVIVENGRAIGVKVKEKQGNDFVEKEYFAEVIISGAGAYTTYNKLIPENVKLPFEDEIKNFPTGISHVTLYIGLKDDPRKLGFEGENYWIYSSYDHDEIYEARNQLFNGNAVACYVSFPSLKNPRAKAHTMEIIAFMDAAPFREWANQPWKNRSTEYAELKQKISDALINFACERITSFKHLIDYQELSTPLSTEYFTGHRDGNIYGLPAIPERFEKKWLTPRSPIKNFYLTGSDIASHGILGALMGGVLTSGMIMGGMGPMKIFGSAKKFSSTINQKEAVSI
jgi:phytoene dehydrogenase-like protein